MKKLYLLAIGLLASGLVHAQSVTVMMQDFQGQKGTSDGNFTFLSIRDKINDRWSADVVFNQLQSTPQKTLSTRIEAGAIYTVPVTKNLSAYVRSAVGQRHRNGNNNEFYSIEPGVSYRMDRITVGTAYRYRAGFNSYENDTTDTYRFRAGYDLTKKDTVGVLYDITRGDTNVNALGVSYTRRF